MTSINFNASATTALRTLQSTNSALETTQNRVATGLKIGEAKDNAAYWAISTTLKSDNKSLSTVKDALSLGAATVDTAYQGLNKTLEVLDEIKSKLTSATQDGVDRNVIQNEIKELQLQLKSIASSSTFSGENWLSVDSSVTGYNADKQVVASFSRDSSNAVSIGTIEVKTGSIVLFDASTTKSGLLDAAKSLSLDVGGVNAVGGAPAKQGLDAAVPTNGTAAVGAKAAVASLGTLNFAGLDAADRITLNIAVDGGSSQFVEIDLSTVTSSTTPADFGSLLTTQINAIVGASAVTAAVNATTGEITITSGTQGSASSIVVSGLAAADGNGVATTALGLSNAQIATFGTGTAATSTFTFGGTAVTGDTLDFRFQYNGEVYQAGQVALATGESAATFAVKLQAAVNTAVKLVGGGTIAANAVTVTNNAGAISFATAGTGTDQNIGIVQVDETTALGTANANINMGLAVTATIAGTGAAATYNLGTYSNTGYDAGDRVQFGVTLFTNNAGTMASQVETLDVVASNSIGGFTTNLQTAFNDKFGAGKVLVSNNGTTISVATVGTGVNAGLSFDTLVGLDGNGAPTSTLGMSTATVSAAGAAATTLTASSVLAGSTFSGAMTFDDQDTLSFNVAVTGTGAASKTITIDKATIGLALTSSDGVITDADDFATVVNYALQNQGMTGLSATNDGGKLKIESNVAGAGAIAISAVAASSGSDTISVSTIDISDAGLTGSDAVSADQIKAVLSAYIAVVSDAMTKITTAASTLGSVSSRIDLQNSFVDTLMDTIDKGVSNLVDADLSEESTRLQALQTKQQLGIQALSIANSSQQNIMRLFQ